MNQAEEESLYHSLEEETINADCLLVEPRSDQVSVSGVWCFEEGNNLRKSENDSYNLGVGSSSINMEGADTTNLNALDALPHEVEVGNFLTTSNVSPCDDYLLDFGFDHDACIGYASNERLHVENFQFPMKGSFGIQKLSTENISGSECENYFLSNCVSGASINSSEPKSLDRLDRFDDFSKSFINQDIIPPQFSTNGLDSTPNCKDIPTSTRSVQSGGDGAIAQKRSRKPTKRYIDESSIQSLKNSKKRREASSGYKVKPLGSRRVKSQNEVKPKDKSTSFDISFDKAIQVPFVCQGSTECHKKNSPAEPQIEKRVETYLSGSEDDSETMIRSSMTSGNQRKLHRLWSVSEVKKLIDGVAHFGVGKWTHIKRLLFSSSVHRTPVDLKDKWRNLLKASHVIKGSRIEQNDQKRNQPWRPLPKSILCRVRELASVYPYPRESNPKISRSKLPLPHHVSPSPALIKTTSSSKVPVV